MYLENQEEKIKYSFGGKKNLEGDIIKLYKMFAGIDNLKSYNFLRAEK